MEPDAIQHFAKNFTLSDQNADPNKWEWKHKWEPAEDSMQQFRDSWYGATTDNQSSQSMSLNLKPLPHMLDPVISSLFVRDSYVSMYNTVWARAMATKGRRGVLITEQPGVGKTLFLYYLLIRLLQLKQVIIFSPFGTRLYLFYHDKVYARSMQELSLEDSNETLPMPESLSNVFIWSLLDIREKQEPCRLLVTSPCFPIQTASPDPVRYKIWTKEKVPLFTGLPLWTRDELIQGLQCQCDYNDLIDALHKVYGPSPANPSDALNHLIAYPGLHALLAERYCKDDKSPSPKDVLDYILDTAINHFGYSARDVFNAVFNFSAMTTVAISKRMEPELEEE